MQIKNFRSYQSTSEIPVSGITAIIGKNDSGKSTLLRALNVFLRDGKIYREDLPLLSDDSLPFEIILTFCDVSNEELKSKKLLNKNGDLVLKKIFKEVNKKYTEMELNVFDYEDEKFRGLYSKKESELNRIASDLGLDSARSGRSRTNLERIVRLTEYARTNGLQESEAWLKLSPEIEKEVLSYIPAYHLFSNEAKLDTDSNEFQKPFQEIISENLKDDEPMKNALLSKINSFINEMTGQIKLNLKEQTDSVNDLRFLPEFQWDKLISISINVVDKQNVEIPLINRGSGIRRLIVASFLKYLSEHINTNRQIIYAIEEPETSLHPSAQRGLINSFKTLVERGSQVLFTSHSPVFVAELSLDQVLLTKRDVDASEIIFGSELDLETIINELGIEPQDILGGFSSYVFLEGDADIEFFQTVSKKLWEGKIIRDNFADKRVGLFPFGGSNLKSYVERKLFKSLGKQFTVIVDSDKKNEADTVKKYDNLKRDVESDGGKFIILKKREVENYVHANAYKRVTQTDANITDYDDVKKKYFNDNKRKFIGVLQEMTTTEILERDKYTQDDGNEGHEILEIINSLLAIQSVN